MKNLQESDFLKLLILENESASEYEGKLLRGNFNKSLEGLKPVNIIKKSNLEIVSNQYLKKSVVKAAIGLSAGFVVKKNLMGNSHSPLKKLSGMILEMVIASRVTANAEEIKAIANIVLKKNN